MTREELYRKFGPLLIDAIVQVTMSEINILRDQLGLPERTGTQLITAINDKLGSLELYDWMK